MDLNNHRYEFNVNDEFLELTFSNRLKLMLNLNSLSIQKSMINKEHFIIKDDYFYLELDHNLNDNFKNTKINDFMLKLCVFLQ